MVEGRCRCGLVAVAAASLSEPVEHHIHDHAQVRLPDGLTNLALSRQSGYRALFDRSSGHIVSVAGVASMMTSAAGAVSSLGWENGMRLRPGYKKHRLLFAGR